MKLNDRVRYSRAWLRSVSCFTGNLPIAKGIIRKLRVFGKNLQIAEIEWDLLDVPMRVNVKNLEPIRTRE